jgi:hypothetical protein
MLWKPQTARDLAEFFTRICAMWDATPEHSRADMIDPNEPVVMCTPNPEWNGDDAQKYDDDDEGEPYYNAYHVGSHGGGGDVDEDGEDCGHMGAQLTGQEIDQRVFLSNGRRLSRGIAGDSAGVKRPGSAGSA